MKHFYSGMLVALALVMALVVGVVALAESADNAPEVPAIEAAPSEAPSTDASATDDTALRDALNAYNQARQSSKVDELEAELKGYVAAGKLTQEQADLVLNYYKEQEALRNGTCPSCGYQFQSGNGGFGRGGRMGGGKGGRMGGGRGGFGQQGMNAQGMSGQANGTAFEGGVQALPGGFGDENI